MSLDATSVFTIGQDELDITLFRKISRGQLKVELSSKAIAKIDHCDLFRQKLAVADKRVYGVNTGFGKLADTVIPIKDQSTLQENLIRSHAVGWGPVLPAEVVRGMILLRAMSLAHGFSGIRTVVVQQLLWLLEEGLVPWIPSRGSVGASGDLAPLSHLALVLMGEGHLLDQNKKRIKAGPILAKLSREPVKLEAKEGLALINGTQMMNSIGLCSVARAFDLVKMATLATTLSLEALEGSALPFGAAYQAVRPHPEINDVAAAVSSLLAGSEVLAGHRDCVRVQDPYSVRCSPQVLGSSLGIIRQAAKVLLRESSAVTDNPVLFPDTGEVVTGGHFHGQPLAHQLDFLYQSVSEIANIAERRVNLLLSGNSGRLPRFLAADPGLESGLMIIQYLAAGLASENKSKAFPATVDSIPTSDGQEDHVSMGSVAAFKLEGVLDRTETVVAIELLTAARALQFITRADLCAKTGRKPLKLAPPLQQLMVDLDMIVDLDPVDRPLTDDVQAVADYVRTCALPAATAACLTRLNSGELS